VLCIFLRKKCFDLMDLSLDWDTYNVHMYHEYNIVWFNIIVHARILSDSLRHSMVRQFILISSFSPRRLPAEKLLQKRCSHSIAFESRLLKAANVVTYFTTRKDITTSVSCFTFTTGRRNFYSRYLTNDCDRKKQNVKL